MSTSERVSVEWGAGMPDYPGTCWALVEQARDIRPDHVFLADDHVERVLTGREGEGDAAIAKITFAETYHRVSSVGVRLAASGSLPEAADSARAALGRLQDSWLWSRAYTVSAGSSEMMRNIIAKRRLRLPQPPRADVRQPDGSRT